jgi:hypothetical protein
VVDTNYLRIKEALVIEAPIHNLMKVEKNGNGSEDKRGGERKTKKND